jgi:GNAT superfamily N-acetyltransferase
MKNGILIRNTSRRDLDAIIELSRRVYPGSPPWRADQLASHLDHFPGGQFVAVDASGGLAGMAASLIIRWDDYEFDGNWRDFTDAGMFTNHDPLGGRTLYGAEVMVDPLRQGRGVGSMLYHARRLLAERMDLPRIRAAARLRNYARFAGQFTPHEYVRRVVRGELKDPTLSFQLKHGFEVLAVVSDYLPHDSESLGFAAVIEWRNPLVKFRDRKEVMNDAVQFSKVDRIPDPFQQWSDRPRV